MRRSPGFAPPRPGTRSDVPIAGTLGATCGAADDGHPRLRHALVKLDDVLDGRVSGRRERDHEPLRLGTGGGKVAEVDGGGAPAEVPPRDPVEPEVDAFDER